MEGLFGGLWGVAFIIFIVVVVWAKRRRRRVGPGAIGAMYDWETRDKRRATELIVEQRAEARDPEHADGDPHSAIRNPRSANGDESA